MGIIVSFVITMIFYILFKINLIDYNNQSIILIAFVGCIFLFSLYFGRTKGGICVFNKFKSMCYRYIKQLGFKEIREEEDEISFQPEREKLSRKKVLEKKLETMYRYNGSMNYSELCYFQDLLTDYKNGKYSDYKKYIDINIWVLEAKLENEKNEKDFCELIDLLLDRELYNKAKRYSEMFYKFHKCEESYLKLLKYYYTVKDAEKFNNIFYEFMSSTIRFSDKGIELVKFWIS